ncbi:hypothetical protein NEOKW01_1536 [Nematocida sp. AWRm80]|nr:hypothetical protein NEOKW01_1536 [Nematocida sp. AWRm80]
MAQKENQSIRLEYLRKVSEWSIKRYIAIIGILLVRQLDLSTLISKYSYYDITECIESINGNKYSDKQYYLGILPLYILGERLFKMVILLCDIYCTIQLDNLVYLLIISILPRDSISLVNAIIITLYQIQKHPKSNKSIRVSTISKDKNTNSISTSSKIDKNTNSTSSKIDKVDKVEVDLSERVLPKDSLMIVIKKILNNKTMTEIVLSSVLVVIFLENTCANHKPGINPYWYSNLQMIPQYRTMHTLILYSIHYYLMSISPWSILLSTKVFMWMVFKECGYKGYLLIWCILLDSYKSIPHKGIIFLMNTSIALAIVEHIIWIMLVIYNTGNMNFLCWITLLFILSTAGAVLLAEVHQKSLYTASITRCKSK